MIKYLSIILNAEYPFIPAYDSASSKELDTFFNQISYTYLPLLRMCNNLTVDNIKFKFAIAFEGSLCAMLSNEIVIKKYIDNLDKKIYFCELEVKRFKDNKEIISTLNVHKNLLEENKKDLLNYNCNILSEFNKYAQKGEIEILATSATSAFLPFYINIPEAIAGQIETGKINYREFFSELPSGFWISGKAGYITGLEKIIRSYGFDYTILDTKSFLFSEKIPSYGIFSPAMTDSNLAVLSKDITACNEIYGSDSYMDSSVYMDTNKDIGFELDERYLSNLFEIEKGRRKTGFKYYSKHDENTIYNVDLANEEIINHANQFLNNRINTFSTIESSINNEVPLVSNCTIDAHLLGTKWFEGIKWLEQVFRTASKHKEINFALPKTVVCECKQIEKITPFFSSMFEDGYAGQILNNDNSYIYKYLIKITEKMVDLAERFPNDTGLKQRVLNMAAREVLLAQSTIWPILSNTASFRSYAESHFFDHVKHFNLFFDSLGSGVISTKVLTEREKLYPVFPELNYRSFIRKK